MAESLEEARKEGHQVGYAEGFTAGLEEAKRRLRLTGLHDGRCPEPNAPCNCGLDAAIDTFYAPGAKAIYEFDESEPVH